MEPPPFPVELWDAIAPGTVGSFDGFRTLARANWDRGERFRAQLLDSLDGAAPEVGAAISSILGDEGSHQRAALPPLLTHLLAPDSSAAAAASLWMGLACELLHVGTLVHDDIVDEQPKRRRHNDAVWVARGVPMAVLLGDLLMGLGHRAIGHIAIGADDRSDLADAYAHAACSVHELQAAELILRQRAQLPSLRWCERTTVAKTGALFDLAFSAGVICADGGGASAAAAGRLGRDLGTCFQILDDVADSIWDDSAHGYGDDLWEAKPSWIIATAAAVTPDRPALGRLLYLPRLRKTDADLAELAELLDDADAVGRTIDEFARHADRVRARLDTVGPLAPAVATFLHGFEAQAATLRNATIGPSR